MVLIIMRKLLSFIAIAVLIAVLGICLYGCERMHTPDDSKLQNVSETEADTEAIDEKVDYTAKYSDVLAEMYYLIIDVEANENLDDGFVGVLEAARALGDAALEKIGYQLYDINGDEKVSYYGVQALYSVSEGMYFKEAVVNGENGVYVYTYENENGDLLYAMWATEEGQTYAMGDCGDSYDVISYDKTTGKFVKESNLTSYDEQLLGEMPIFVVANNNEGDNHGNY